MFNFDNASLQIDKSQILKYITELQIFERYCLNYNGINSSFKSEFYHDTKPSCRIIISASGIPYYKDFGSGDYFTAFEYVSRKYGSNYHETCNIIANDFGLKKIKLNVSPQLLINNKDVTLPKLTKVKSELQVIPQPFNIHDCNYWKQYEISLQTLDFFNVKACSNVLLKKDDKYFHFEYKKTNPIYSYRFYKNNKEYFKIYFPLANPENQIKWLSTVGSDCLQGYDQLPDHGDILLITKSLKDVMCFYELGIFAVGLQAETNKMSKKSFEELSQRFKRLVLVLDNDHQGRTSTGDFILEYDIEFFFIDNAKDISDYIKAFGLKKAKKLIKNKLL
jgi:hypothetical protein